MLTRLGRATVVLLCSAAPIPFPAGARANDSFHRPNGTFTATTICDSAICHEAVGVSGSRTGKRVPPSRPEKEEPVCHDVPLALYEFPVIVSGHGSGPADLAQELCYLHDRLVSTRLIFISRTNQTGTSAAQKAYAELVPPKPELELSPSPPIPQLTGLPVWLFLAPGTWTPKTSSASAGPLTVTATATPQSVTWSMGDGATVTCVGPGTPYHEEPGSDGLAPSPDCGHTYHRTSADQPGGTFEVTATIAWHVVWSGAGKGGEFPNLRSSAHLRVRVIEASALVTTNPG